MAGKNSVGMIVAETAPLPGQSEGGIDTRRWLGGGGGGGGGGGHHKILNQYRIKAKDIRGGLFRPWKAS